MLNEIKSRLRHGDSLTRLLAVNVGVFLLINVYLLILFFADKNPSVILGEDLLLGSSSNLQVMLHRPWSLLTHMFAHIEFGHFFFNVIALYFMGTLFTQIAGSKRLTTLYILGGLCGYLFFFLFFNLLPRFKGIHMAMGASAAVMAVSVACAVLRPTQIVHIYGVFRVELRWLVFFLVLLDLASIRSGSNSGGHIGHLGGAFYGFIYARQMQNGKTPGRWFTILLDRINGLFTRKRMKTVVNNGRPKTDEQFNAEKLQKQKRIDEILDKIGRSGYDALTKEEKDFLFRNSQR